MCECRADACDVCVRLQVSDCEVKYQQLGLLNALLRIGDIRDARALLDTIPDSTDFLLYQPRLLRTLADLFHYLIEPLYVKFATFLCLYENCFKS